MCVHVFVSIQSHLAIDETVNVGEYYSGAQASQSCGLKQTIPTEVISHQHQQPPLTMFSIILWLLAAKHIKHINTKYVQQEGSTLVRINTH